MQIRIQPIEKIHFEEVLELLKNISEYAPPKNSYSTIWKNFINQENNYALVALFNNKVVGFGVVVVETKIRGGRLGHIEDIVTDRNMQKKGIGKRIMDSLLEICKQKNCYKVALHCKEHNVEFYKRCGYSLGESSMNLII